ncbi:MAG: DMT family transporter [Actinomycetota bacterium]|nr:DMT family transporter [Actinomycetota bacterium]
MPTTSRTRGLVLIAALALLWGSNFLWIALALRAFTPAELTFGRMLLGALVLLPVVFLRRERLPRDPGTWGYLAVAGLISNAAPYLLFALGETRVSSGVAGAINATTPLWTLALVILLRQEQRPTPAKAAGFALGFVGCTVMFSPWQTDGIDTRGGLYCLGAALCYALSYLYMARYLTHRKISLVTLSAGQLITATLWTVPALLISHEPGIGTAPEAWTALLILGLLGTGAAYVINYALVRTEGASGASVVTYVMPLVSLTLGAVFANEIVSGAIITGAALVLLGVAMTRRSAPRPVTR